MTWIVLDEDMLAVATFRDRTDAEEWMDGTPGLALDWKADE